MIKNNVFSGPDSLKDFLNPDNHPPIPLVELPQACNPFTKDGVRIFAKMMHMVPLANVKSLPAYNMLLEAERNGGLEKVSSLIESSSGNTVFSLAVVARIFSIEKTCAIVSHEVTEGKLKLLRFFGTNITVTKDPICPDPQDKNSGIYKARELGTRKGWMNPGQYNNEANPDAHKKWTGPQIWKQTSGKISIFCAGLGTTGTLVGAGGFLKRKNKKLSVLGVVRSANNPVPGVRTKNLLREISFDWEDIATDLAEAGTVESFEKSLELCRMGLLAGPSSGFAFAGLLKFLEEAKKENRLEHLKNKDGEIVAVFVCPDSPFPYVDDYFEQLGAGAFPSIENSELLSKEARSGEISKTPTTLHEIDPLTAYSQLYKDDAATAWKKLENNERVILQDNVEILDIRHHVEFGHFHLPSSKHADACMFLPEEFDPYQWKDKKVFVICPIGERSKSIVSLLRENKIEAYSIQGGIIEWSRQNLPRWRPNICKKM